MVARFISYPNDSGSGYRLIVNVFHPLEHPMTTTDLDPSSKIPRPRGLTFLRGIVIASILACGLLMVLQESIKPNRSTSQRQGYPAPVIRVEGWLNGPGPSASELRDRVMVIDAWAYWCGPCRARAPEVVALEKKYRSRGVVFIGLTMEGTAHLAESRDFLAVTGIGWPNGYGALETLQELHTESIPRLWVINRENLVTWDSSSRGSIESAIEKALAHGS